MASIIGLFSIRVMPSCSTFFACSPFLVWPFVTGRGVQFFEGWLPFLERDLKLLVSNLMEVRDFTRLGRTFVSHAVYVLPDVAPHRVDRPHMSLVYIVSLTSTSCT